MSTRLTNAVAAIAGRVALRRTELPTLDLGTVVRGTWAGHALHDCAASQLLLDDDGSIALKLVQPRFVYPGIVEHAPTEEPVEITTSTGLLRARYGDLANSSFGTDGTRASLHLDEWTWSAGPEPIAWLGVLDGARLRRGNLGAVDDARSNSTGQLLEGGGLRWYLWPVNAPDRGRRRAYQANVLLEVLQGRVDAVRVACSLGVVDFVLGGATRLRRLVGVGENGRPVAAFSVEGMEPRPEQRARCPVPDDARDPRWHGQLFRRVADAVEREGAADYAFLATQSYVDSLGQHLDGAYLTAQVALEAFAARASRKETESRVTDKSKWIAWVDEREAEIASMAVDAAKAAVLVNVARGAWRESSSRTVGRYFERKGVPLPREVLSEVLLRNTVAHQMLMGDADTRDVGADLTRLAVIQTVLVAALALHVGYAGPIAGGENSDHDPLWWPHRPGPAPDGTFLIDLREV